MQILPWIHALCCLVLAGAACHLLLGKCPAPAYGPLLPFVAATVVTGGLLLFPLGMECWVAEYSGVHYERADGSPLNVDLRQMVAWAGVPLLPSLGLIPWVGNKPWLVIVLSTVAVVSLTCVVM